MYWTVSAESTWESLESTVSVWFRHSWLGRHTLIVVLHIRGVTRCTELSSSFLLFVIYSSFRGDSRGISAVKWNRQRQWIHTATPKATHDPLHTGLVRTTPSEQCACSHSPLSTWKPLLFPAAYPGASSTYWCLDIDQVKPHRQVPFADLLSFKGIKRSCWAAKKKQASVNVAHWQKHSAVPYTISTN